MSFVIASSEMWKWWHQNGVSEISETLKSEKNEEIQVTNVFINGFIQKVFCRGWENVTSEMSQTVL